jgi:hypothetical protein
LSSNLGDFGVTVTILKNVQVVDHKRSEREAPSPVKPGEGGGDEG